MILLVQLISSTTFAQDGESIVKKKLESADSILLVSHQDTEGVKVVDSLGRNVALPALIIRNTPNYKIFTERKIIDSAERNTLVKILEHPSGKKIEIGMCFMPHHAILIFKSGNVSYIEICFGCRRFETSKDLKKLGAFDSPKWAELEAYFKKLGFKYELE